MFTTFFFRRGNFDKMVLQFLQILDQKNIDDKIQITLFVAV